MAKELPYFKFEPNIWENGNIQMCSREDKGLFIDLCSMYWSRLGDLPLKLAVQKLCGGNAIALNSLCDEKIIEVIDGNIFIKFLSEQLAEFGDLSKKNSENARSGWEKRRKQKELSDSNATAYDSQWDRNAIREEKIRKDKIKENNINNASLFNFRSALLSYGFDSVLIDEWLRVRKNKKLTNTETAFNKFIKQVELNGNDKNEILEKCIEKSWGGFESDWFKKEIKEVQKVNTYTPIKLID